MASQAAVLAALASPRRREILRLVWNEELTAGAIHQAMPDVTFGAVSLQLRSLVESGVIQTRAKSRNRFYRADREALGALGGMLEQMWDDKLWSLKLEAELEETRRGPRPRGSTKSKRQRRAKREKRLIMQPNLPHAVERTVEILASPETVFRYFTDSARWAKWWGAGSTIEPHPGGKVYIRYPNAVEAGGEVIEIVPPDRIAFSFGYASGQPIPLGTSRVTIRLEPVAGATRLHLRHEFADPAVRDQHVPGWRFQLALFANVVADEVFADAATVVDAWFDTWTVADEQARDAEFMRLCSPDIRFHDRFSLLEGLTDLSAHAAASQRFMPGVRMRRTGDVRHCQGTIVADWVATSGDGKEVMGGTNVFQLGPDTRIRSATGFTNPR
ncbi:MAG: SRPBCC domain-containing protein [Bryobacteraceae bacterium]